MPRVLPQFVLSRLDPVRQRRQWLLLGAAWLASLLFAAALASGIAGSLRRESGRAKLAESRAQNDDLKKQIAVLERSEQVAQAALTEVQQTLRERDEEIDALRADLAFYGRLVGGSQREGLAVHALSLRRVDGSDAWNFTATLTQNFKRGQDIKGRLTLSVDGVRDGKLAALDWAALNQGQDGSGIEYGFKYFQQVNGTIRLPPGFVPARVKVRAEGDGGRAEQEFGWKDAVNGEIEGKRDVRQ